ncbi:MAG: type II toxin-antitoxin system RelE/ParE family toxin [Methylococcaceae bacterium]
MFTINKTDKFNSWLTSLRDLKARTRIAARIKNAEIGNFGDYKPVGEGVYEIRIDVGAGYRVYFYQQADVIYLLLLGGDKKTQKRDIVEAKKMKKQLVLEGK